MFNTDFIFQNKSTVLLNEKFLFVTNARLQASENPTDHVFHLTTWEMSKSALLEIEKNLISSNVIFIF